MLLSQEQVIAAMNLDRDALSAAIAEGGYYDNHSILDVEFKGMNLSGMFVYNFICDDDMSEDGEPYKVSVYVSYKREALSNRIYLSAEY